MIKEYVDQVFAKVPDSQEVQDLKVEMVANMEDKYQTLLDSGHSHNEALGAVITEFGDIDELLVELDLNPVEDELPWYTLSDIQTLMEAWSKRANGIGLGLGICLLAPGVTGSLDTLATRLEVQNYWFVPASFFIILALGVGLTFYFSLIHPKSSAFKEPYFLSYEDKQGLVQMAEAKRPGLSRQMSWAVALIPLALVCPLLEDLTTSGAYYWGSLGIFLMFVLLGLAAFLIISALIKRTGWQSLTKMGFTRTSWLKNKDKVLADKKSKEEAEDLDAKTDWLWLLTLALYFVWSFSSGDWHITWIIFLIAAAIDSLLKQVLYRK